MKLDRQYQRELLQFLLEDYPSYDNAAQHCAELEAADQNKYVANVYYLQLHGLLEDGVALRPSTKGNVYQIDAYPEITQAGIDFILDDGGLSAILGVQTIRLHPDSIKALVQAKIEASTLSESSKGKLLETIQNLPATALTKLSDKLLDKGIDYLLSLGPTAAAAALVSI